MNGLDRRTFLIHAGTSIAVVATASLIGRTARAQGPDGQTAGTQSSASNVEMTPDAYKPVRRPPKRDARRLLDDAQVQAFERQLACPCPCTLDVYTCRTTDFTCGISPAVHRDIQTMVEGGYSADDIMNAMLDSYGDFILMQPRNRGFNLLAWIVPVVALVGGGIGIGALLRGWRRNATAPSAMPVVSPSSAINGIDATSEELAALDAALRDDSR